MTESNFLSLQTYNELCYDSMARKYLFEFQINLNENAEHSILQLENKLRTQISDNFALFNEVNPIYISINMGRPVSNFQDVSLPMEKFQLADRKLVNIGGIFLTVNFLKNDLPFTCLRIMAFNNQTCQSFNLDLTIDDLMVFVEGNQKMLEEDNLPDLYQLLLNNLTMMQRRNVPPGTISTMSTVKGAPAATDTGTLQKVLAIEHRCFFNELYRQNWDARNKLIKARHNKITQGLVAEKGLTTELS